MSKVTEIRIAELFAGNDENIIVTNGIGSCVVIILYDRLMRVGGMAHAILPRAKEFSRPEPSRHRDSEGRLFVKYADDAVDTLISEVESLGGVKEHLVAKIVGGAHMFSLLEGDQYGIGWENTNVARERLLSNAITIETEVIGGTVGRNVRFDCANGIAEIITKV